MGDHLSCTLTLSYKLYEWGYSIYNRYKVYAKRMILMIMAYKQPRSKGCLRLRVVSPRIPA